MSRPISPTTLGRHHTGDAAATPTTLTGVTGTEASAEPHPLDNPARSSLTGPHADFAEQRGNVLRYPVDVSPFAALPEVPSVQDWADLAALAGPGALVPLAGVAVPPPEGWEVVMRGAGVQMVGDDINAAPERETARLTAADVPEMLLLVERTKPGPFLPRTIELGT
jgi:hypothetical protein